MSEKLLREAVGESGRFLLEGERVHRAYQARGGASPWWAVATMLGGFAAGLAASRVVDGPFTALGVLLGVLSAKALSTRRTVLVTDRAVVVLDARRFGFNLLPTAVKVRLPVGTPIPAPNGIWTPLRLGTERLWIHRTFIEPATGLTTTSGFDHDVEVDE